MKRFLLITFLLVCALGLYVAVDVARSVAQMKDSIVCRPGTLGYEIDAGVVGFYQIAQRFPESRAELLAGLDKLKIKPSKLSALKTIKFSRRNHDTIVKYTTADGFEGELAISGPFIEKSETK